MTVTNFKINFPGQNNDVVPRIGHLHSTTDTLATISSAGYLNNYILSQGFSLKTSDVIIAHGTDGSQWYKPVFTGTSCQLSVLP